MALLLAIFLVAPAFAAAPATTVEAPSAVTYTGAHLKGKVNPEAGAGTCWRFEFVNKAKLEASQEGWNQANFNCLSAEDSAKTEALAVGTDLGNLRGGTVYLVRLAASNGDGEDTSSEEEFKTKDVTPPSVTIEPLSVGSDLAATFVGTVNPNAPEAAPTSAEAEAGFRTKFHFECQPSCNVGGNGSGEVAADNSAHSVEHETQLLPNKTYTVKLVAENAGGNSVAETTVETPKLAPLVGYLPSAPVSVVTDSGARLVGSIGQRESGAITECKFEYGPTASYGSTVPCAQEIEGENAPPETHGDIFAAADITGLQPNATYHFRLVAANSVESVAGADNHFTTFPTPPADPSNCPNEAIRIEQKATALPGCRAWEMVSPADKNGGDVELEEWAAPTAADGSAVVFRSKGSFAGTKGSGLLGLTWYIGERTSGGWETHGILPTPPQNQYGVFAGTLMPAFSEELDHGIVLGLDLPAVDDDQPFAFNAYWEDLRTGALTTMSKPGLEPGPPLLWYPFYIGASNAVISASSADQRVFGLQVKTRLLAEAPAGVESVYEWEEGTLRLASILPDGSPAPEGATMPIIGYGVYGGTVSPDGSLVTFLAPKEGQNQLYARRNHTDTVWVSEAEGTSVTAAENIQLQYITPDSRHVLFSTTSKLLAEDTNSGPDLYMYTDSPDPDSEANLTLVSSGDGDGLSLEPGSLSVIMGTSDDGSYVYYPSPEGVVRWKQGSRHLVLAGGISGGPEVSAATGGTPGARVSHDGARLVFMTEKGRRGERERGISGRKDASEEKQLYVYDDEKEMLFCASCLQVTPGSDEELVTSHRVVQEPKNDVPELDPGPWYLAANQTRYLAADGNHVYFSTEEALVPEDTNETYDVYEYDVETGQQRLLSSGAREKPEVFADASADGGTVVFVTKERLLPRDTDGLRDFYVTRSNGGFAEPPPPPTPCVGDGCRGPIPVAPTDSSPTTPLFSGPGDPRPKHCPKGKVLRKGKCAKKHPRRHHHSGGGK